MADDLNHARSLVALDADPDQVAADQARAARLGVTPAAIKDDPVVLKFEKAREITTHLSDAPASSRWYQRNAEIGHDDTENLTATERTLNTMRAAAKTTRLMAYQVANYIGEETPEQGIERRALGREVAKLSSQGLGTWKYPGIRDADPGAWLAMKHAQDAVNYGALAVESLPFMAVTAAGTVASGGAGGFAVAATLEAASSYETMTDQYHLPGTVSRALAGVVGAVNGALEYAGTSKVLGAVLPKTAAKREILDVIGKTARTPGFIQAAGKVLEGMGVEGLTEGAQNITTDLVNGVRAKLAGQEPDYRVKIGDTEYTGMQAVLLSALEAAKVGFTSGAVGGPAEAAGALHEIRSREAMTNQQKMEELLRVAAASKIRERAPAKYVEALKEQIVESGAAGEVYIPAQRFLELYQSASGDDRAELENAFPGISKTLTDTQANNADVTIPMEMWVGTVGHTKIGQQLSKSWRTDPMAMTAEEASAEEERLVTEGRPIMAEDAANPFTAYQREVYDLLRQAGAAPKEAEQAAIGERANLETIAEQRGLTFEEVATRYGRPEIMSFEAAAEADTKGLKQEAAGALDTKVMETMLAEARKPEVKVENPTPEDSMKAEQRAALRADVESLGLTLDSPDSEIIQAMQARAADEFQALASEGTSLFQKRPIERRGVSKWLRDAEKEGNRGMARRLAEHFRKAPPTEELKAAALAGAAKKGWYRKSMLAIQRVFGDDAPRFTSLLAALSPQDSVENSFKNALKVWKAWTDEGRPTDEADIDRILNANTTVPKFDKETGREISRAEALKARRNNTVTTFQASKADVADLSKFKLSGLKVDSFYRNLMGDMEAVTLDAWMATFFGMPDKGKLGSKGRYRALSAAVRKAAQELTAETGEPWSPAEVQETIWSWAKALVEQRADEGEYRTAVEIIKNETNGLDPKRITSVPDFAGLLSNAVYAPLMEASLAERAREAAGGTTERPGEGAQAQAGAAAAVPANAPLERAAARVERVIERRRAAKAAAAGGSLAQRPGLAQAVEHIRGLGLHVTEKDGTIAFVGHDGKTVGVEELNTPEGQKVFHEALGFPTDPTGRDTIADLKVYRLKEAFGSDPKQVEAKLNAWLAKKGWTFKRFGPGTGPNGKPYWPNFRDPATPSYKDKVVFIFSEDVPEGSFFDPAYTLAWRVPHELAHALVNPQMDALYGPGFRAGALGKVVRGPFFKEETARTLNEALRATDWEVETFKAQRAIFEQEFGVDLTEEEFRKENGINYAGALYRAITGQFADPNTVGVLPAALDPEQLQKAGRALLKAVALARGAQLESAPSDIPSGARGVFQYRTNDYTDLSKVRILLGKAQNASTAVHELWHMWWARLEKQALEQLAEGASFKERAAQARAVVQWDKALKYVGAKRGEQLTERQREKLARSGEAYLREGNAPSLALREMFDSFKTWLRRVYRTLMQLEKESGQPIRLSDDIRHVMDRMLATEDQIAEAKAARGFTSANDAAITSLMTDDERQAYEEKLAEADRETRERVAQKVNKLAKQRKRETWNEAVSELRDVVTAGVKARPALAAREWLATGIWNGNGPAPEIASEGLSHEALKAQYGKIPPGLSPAATQKNGGLHPDVAAEALGFTDGDALVAALAEVGKEPVEKIIERELKARVKAELGAPDAIGRDEIVFALAELPSHIEAMSTVERLLAKKAGKKAISKSAVRSAAQRIVDGTPVVQLNPTKYRAAAEREGALATKLAGSGKWGDALGAKRRQMLNVFLEAAAMRAKDEASSIHDRLAFINGPTASVTLIKAGHTYKAQQEALFNRFNLRNVTDKDIERRQTLSEWVAEQEAAGETPPIPDHIRDEAYTKNWRELTVAELRDIGDAANSIYALARRKVSFSAAEKRRDRDEARAELIARLERVTKLPPTQRYADYEDPKERSLGKKILGLGAALDKIITIVDHLDGGDTQGPWHTYVYRPVAEALGRKQDMARAYSQMVHDNIAELVKGKEKAYQARVATDLPWKDAHGRPVLGRFNKIEMLGIALNLGNESNMTKLLEGHGWTEAQVVAELQKNLSAEDWKFVQKTWNLIDTLWPAIAKQEAQLNGVNPTRVIPREFQVLTADGKTATLQGGYFPVVYDPDPSKTNWAHKNASRGLFEGVENHFMRAITGHGHTKARTEVTGPILFDLAIIPRHLDEVIHDLAFRATLLDVDVLLDTKEIKGALARALGDQYATIFRPWLQSIAQDRVFEPQMMRPWAKMLSRIRTRATSAVLFFRDTTILAQVSGHAPALAEMRAHFGADEGWSRDFWDACKTAAHHNVLGIAKGTNPSAEFVEARSAFMRARTDNADRDRRDQVRQMQGDVLPGNQLLKKGIALGGALIANTQYYGVDVPVWIAAFNAGQRLKGLNERDAAFLADQIVRISQGSGESIDLSEMQRGNEWQKQFTTFYSYLASQYAAFVRDARGLKAGTISKGEFMVRFGLRFTLPALYMTAVRAALPGKSGGPDLEDDDWWDEAWWALGQTGIFDLAGAVPLLRDIVPWLKYGRVSPTIPVARVAQEVIEAGQEVKRAVTDEVRPAELFADVLDVIAMVSGAPLKRAADLIKMINEEEE